MIRNYYDPYAQMARAEEWLAEAVRVECAQMREFCLSEAARCYGMVKLSLDTPVLHEPSRSAARGQPARA